MRLAQFISRTLLALALLTGLSTEVLSLAVTEWVEAPLPVEYHKRAGELLKSIRPKDADRALDGVKAIMRSSYNRSDTYIIMRVELDCPDAHCMTLVGRIKDETIDLDFLLEAGPAVQFGDVRFELWGSKTEPPWIFEARGGAGVVAVLREQGWVLTACTNCTGNMIKPPPRLPPPPAPKFDTYESFRRALKEEDLN